MLTQNTSASLSLKLNNNNTLSTKIFLVEEFISLIIQSYIVKSENPIKKPNKLTF